MQFKLTRTLKTTTVTVIESNAMSINEFYQELSKRVEVIEKIETECEEQPILIEKYEPDTNKDPTKRR